MSFAYTFHTHDCDVVIIVCVCRLFVFFGHFCRLARVWSQVVTSWPKVLVVSPWRFLCSELEVVLVFLMSLCLLKVILR